MSAFAISARNISKRFRPRGRLMLRQEFGRLVRGMRPSTVPPLVTAKSNGHGRAPWHQTSTEWALRDVSFEMQHGECMGVIGHNGAGKSVLLRVLARVTRPTYGEADLVGRVSAVLDVGAGFNRELSGRDNIYLQGAILGMKKREIAQKFDAIVAFSGMEQFLELPLKQYSNGMQVRLAFAVAAHLDPEIFLMDEVLAVADAEFQRACIEKLGELVRQGRTVMIVGHDMAMLTELCPRTLWLERGQVMADGVTESVIAQYQARVAEIARGNV